MNHRDAYILTLHAEGAGPPVTVRLRRGLKLLLRACGLRCTDIRQAADGSLSAQVTDKKLVVLPSQSPPIANAGRVVASLRHANPPDVSEQGSDNERRKLAMAGAGGASEVKSCR